MAKADRRTELEKIVADARAALPVSGARKSIANPDALALQGFAQAFGLTADAEMLNRLLVVLAVLVIELGGGLAFALGHGLRFAAAAPANSYQAHAPIVPVADQIATALAAPSPDTPPSPQPEPVAPTDSDGPPLPPPLVLTPPEPDSAKPKRTRRDDRKPPRGGQHHNRITDTLAARGGRIDGGQRDLARMFGLSKSRAGEIIHELAASGHVTLSTCRTGTRIELAAA